MPLQWCAALKVAHAHAGSIKAFYHRSMSLNFPQASRSSSGETGRSSSTRHSPLHSLRSSLKRATSEGFPAETEPMCPKGNAELPEGPEAGQAAGEWSFVRQPHRSSLKTSLSRRNSLQACGSEMEPTPSRRISVRFA